MKISREKVKRGKLRLQKKNIKDSILKKHKPTDMEREQILDKARKEAHSIVSDKKRDMSNSMRDNLNIKESCAFGEGFDFIEESFGTGVLEYDFLDKPVKTLAISEEFKPKKKKYKTLGEVKGILAPIGVMSRNNRIYDEDHYDYLLEDTNLQNRIHSRGMLGTIGHHQKKVDDEDLAKGTVSHVVTDVHIVECEDGSRALYGEIEILDTPAGRLLKSYYEQGIPLYVSTRGGGKLLPVVGESYKRVDKTHYFLETFDFVKEPGFLQAKPEYVGITEKLEDNNINEDYKMANEKANIEKISTDMSSKEIIDTMLNPLKADITEMKEQISSLVSALTESPVDEAKEDAKAEKMEDKAEKKEDKAIEKMEKAQKIEKEAEKKEDAGKKAEGEKEEAKAEKMEKEAAKEMADAEKEEAKAEKIEESKEVSEAKKEEEAHKLEADAEEDKAKAKKLEKDADYIDDVDEAKEDKAENIAAIEPDKNDACKEEKINEEKCGKKECDEGHCEKHYDKADAKEDEAIAKKIKADAKEDEEDAEELDEALIGKLLSMTKQLASKLKDTTKSLNAYKITEEFKIEKEEALKLLESKEYEDVKADLSKINEEKEEVVDESKKDVEAVEKGIESISEAVEEVKPVHKAFSVFSKDEKGKVERKAFSVFKDL